ncbi:hypothetical protein GCU56_16715 [Geodermatophilus sabuli]|uniref:Uncharacterized protein n=1 Tax=Geodermatophilus sabuli TaxID=1564158 RepID=A0A7K3W3N1_9ACTN|nr:hypothetical protein [Geodermatophilus sabuli]NEK59501.1 hypothetical protein [Geodermatophilus sabuli]
MSQPAPGDGGQHPPSSSADPTRRVARPPRPGRAVRADVAAGRLARPPVHEDDPTVTLAGRGAETPAGTLEWSAPGPDEPSPPRPRRRHRTWPWIAAVVVVLLVLGAVLLVMLLRGATIDGDTGLLGPGRPPVPAPAASSAAGPVA